MTSSLGTPTSKSLAAVKELFSFKQVTCGLGTTYLFQLTCLLRFHGSRLGSIGCIGWVTCQHCFLGWVARWSWGESCDLALVYYCLGPLSPDSAERVACAILFSDLTAYTISYLLTMKKPGSIVRRVAERTQGSHFMLLISESLSSATSPHPTLFLAIPFPVLICWPHSVTRGHSSSALFSYFSEL